MPDALNMISKAVPGFAATDFLEFYADEGAVYRERRDNSCFSKMMPPAFGASP